MSRIAGTSKIELWLPIVDTFRTFAACPPPAIRGVFQQIGDSGEAEQHSGGKPNTIPVIANTIGAKRRWQVDFA
jgi:hypothetical protein